MDDFNPENCPVGIRHEEQIFTTRKVVDMAIERLEEKMDDIKEDVTNGFANVDTRFNSMEDRFNTFENNLPSTVDQRIKASKDKAAGAAAKWISVSLIGSTIILIFGKWVLSLLGM